MVDENRILELAVSVADGELVDWQEVERITGGQEERELVGALREISQIGAACRSWQESSVLPVAATEVLNAGGERWGHLEILEKVGEGAFGDVYRARDLKLDREVALKLLRRDAGIEETGIDPLAEARLLARIRHPNVASVYGADRREGRVGFWMEFIAGRTLTELLVEQGPLSPREAILVGIELCRALAAVHAQGIVHRDIKAQNVMREKGGRIVLTDFGIGKDLRSGSESDRSLSGTPLYLAPEVLAGEAATVQSDLYGLGVLLFHLVTGSFPLCGRSMSELRAAHEVGEVRLLRDIRPDLPEPFVRAVERALTRDPLGRYASAGAFERTLGELWNETAPRPLALLWPIRPDRRALRLAAVAVLPAVLLLAILWTAGQSAVAAPYSRVLVTDFDNRTGVALFESAHHLMSLALDQAPQLKILSPEEIAAALKRMHKPPGSRLDADTSWEICRRENLGTLVSGEISRTPRGYRLVASATDPAIGATRAVRSTEFQDAHGLIAAIDHVAAELRHDLGEPRALIEQNHRPLEQATTSSLEALELYSQALDLQTRGRVDDAIASLKMAVELDPDFALAHCRLAVYLGGQGKLREALTAAETAYHLRSHVSRLESYRISGAYHLSTLRYAEALSDYKKAMLLDPDDADSSRLTAFLHVNLGKPGEGLADARVAHDRHPDHVINQGMLALMLAIAGRPDDALKEIDRMRQHLGRQPYFNWSEGLAWLMKDDVGRAEEAFGRLAGEGEEEGSDYTSYGRLYLAQTFVYQGSVRQAAGELEAGLGADAREGYERSRMIRNDFLARIYLLLGDEQEARRQTDQLKEQVQDVPIDLKQMRSAALLYVKLGDLTEARQILVRIERQRDLYPSDIAKGIAAQVRGEIDSASGNLSAARESLEQARLDWEDPATLASLARFWAGQGQCNRAIPLFQEVLSRKGWVLHEFFAADWVLAHLELARCRSQVGQFAEARASYDDFLRLWGEHETDLYVVGEARRERSVISYR